MSPKESEKKVSGYGGVQRCLYSLFQNNPPPPLFALLSFLKIISTLRPDQDQQNSIQTYCQLPITIFLWTPKCFISPESFLNFLLNLYIPPWLPKSFKFIVLRLLQIGLWVRLTGIAHSSQTAFSEDIFSWAEKGGERIIAKKLPKSQVFDKFHYLCNLYSFGLCFAVH